MARIVGDPPTKHSNVVAIDHDHLVPTEEQGHVQDLFDTGDSLAVEAGAGTGKTTTLAMLARSTWRRGQYMAFNRSIVDDSAGKFPWTVSCLTAHQVAYRAIGHRYEHRMNSARIRTSELARMLGLDGVRVEYSGAARNLRPGFMASLAQRTVLQFCQSGDDVPAAVHVPWIDGIDEHGQDRNNRMVAEAVLPGVQRLWEDLSRPDGRLPGFTHAHYLKIWQLNDPRIQADYILFDEAQDANGVMLAAVLAQTHAQLVWVGDSQQQVNEWMGSVNALSKVGADRRAFLTQSFRFGPAIADVANGYLELLGAELRLRGADRPSTVGPVEKPVCILSRTNASALTVLLGSGRRTHMVGGGTDMIRFCQAARELQAGKGTSYAELACFQTWGDVQEYVRDEEGTDLKLLVQLIDRYGAERIEAALRAMPDERSAELVVSTAHKAKGREWTTVRLADDFPPQDEASPAELRLLYVAVTRARDALDVPFFLDDAGDMASTQPSDSEARRSAPPNEPVSESPEPCRDLGVDGDAGAPHPIDSPDAAEEAARMDESHLTLPVGLLEPHPANPREAVGDISDLATSIDSVGVAQALLVTPREDGEGYLVIAGTRRLAAARLAGVKALECVVRHDLDDDTVRVLALAENGHRKSLSPLEEARTVRALLDGGQSQRGLARQIGRSQAWISNRVALLRLPEDTQADVDAGRLSAEEAVDGHRERRPKRTHQPVAEEERSRGNDAAEAGGGTDVTAAPSSGHADTDGDRPPPADSAQVTLDEVIESAQAVGATSPKPAEPLLDEDLDWIARRLGGAATTAFVRKLLDAGSNAAAGKLLQWRFGNSGYASKEGRYTCAGGKVTVECDGRKGQYTFLRVAQRIIDLVNRGEDWFTGAKEEPKKSAPKTINGTATPRMEVPPAPATTAPPATKAAPLIEDEETARPALFAHWVDGRLETHLDAPERWTVRQWDELAAFCRQQGGGQRGLRHSDADVNAAVSGAVDAATDEVVSLLTGIVHAWDLTPAEERPTGALAVRILEARAELCAEIDEDDPKADPKADPDRARLERHLARLQDERKRLADALARNGGGSRYGEDVRRKPNNDRRRAEVHALDDAIRGVREQLAELEPADPTPADYELDDVEASAPPPLAPEINDAVVHAALAKLGEGTADDVAAVITQAGEPYLRCTGAQLGELLRGERIHELRVNDRGQVVYTLALVAPLPRVVDQDLPEDMRVRRRPGVPPAAHMDLVSAYLRSRPNEPCSVAKIWAAHKRAGVSQDEILAACQWLAENVSDVHADSRRVFRVVKSTVGATA